MPARWARPPRPALTMSEISAEIECLRVRMKEEAGRLMRLDRLAYDRYWALMGLVFPDDYPDDILGSDGDLGEEV